MNISPPLLNRDTAVLTPFVDAGILDASAVHVADAIARGVGGIDFESLLGAALAARAPALGHVCIVPATVADSIVIDDSRAPAPNDLPWPDPDLWVAGIAASPAVRVADDPPGPVVLPLVWDGTRLYLERYWRYEQHVADDLLRRAGTPGGVAGDYPDLDSLLDPLFGPGAGSGGNRQREAAERALTSRLVVVAGGPGTGKTYTIARLLTAALRVSLARGQTLDFALAAPTGKASARMTEAVRDEIATTDLDQRVSDALRDAEATTIHRLLGPTPGIRFRHDQTNPLPHDLVIVDETSMVSLPLMSRLLAAVRPDATVVLVGDPYQLASVEAGAVLGEIVGTSTPTRPEGPLAHDVVLLERVHRFGADSPIAALADAVRVGDADLAVDLLRTDRSGELTWVDGDDAAGISVLQQEAAAGAVEAIRAAHAGDASAGIRHASDLKVLCATRLGRLGVAAWSDRIEALAARVLPDAGIGRRWYVGRPIIVVRNDYLNHLNNGDVGVLVAGGGRPAVAFPAPDGIRELATSQLGDVETWWAMTIHKSQGSEFRRVIVSLPPPPSPILTRELLYTAITRASEQVTLVAGEAALRAAVATPVARASGLGERLWP